MRCRMNERSPCIHSHGISLPTTLVRSHGHPGKTPQALPLSVELVGLTYKHLIVFFIVRDGFRPVSPEPP